MSKILKFEIKITDEQYVRLPYGYEVLCVQIQNEVPHIWVKGDFDNAEFQEQVKFRIYGTGHPIDEHGLYIGTFQQNGVWHLFEI